MRIYNRALAQAEIQTDMNTAVGGTPPPDTTPPSAPTGLSPTVSGSSQIDLSWTASTDNVGVTGYRVERCQGSGCSTFGEIGSALGTTYTDIGLVSNTTTNIGCGGPMPQETSAPIRPLSSDDPSVGHPATNCAGHADGNCGKRDPGQSELGSLAGQRRGHRISSRALPGRRMHRLREGPRYASDTDDL